MGRGSDSSKQWASDADWESNREIITQLYMQEGKTLPQLTEVMERDHDFNATKKQYKRRFKLWGLTKYVKATDVLEAVQRATEGSSPDDEDRPDRKNSPPRQVVVNGKEIDLRKYGNYINRRRRVLGVSSAAPYASHGLAPSSAAAALVARRTTPYPGYFSGPDRLQSEEHAYYTVRDFFDWNITRGQWDCTSHTEDSFVHASAREGRQLIVNFMIRMSHSVVMLQNPGSEQAAEGLKMVRISFAELETVLASQDPLLLLGLLGTLFRVKNGGPAVQFLVPAMLQQIASLASVPQRNGARHPMEYVWKLMRNANLNGTLTQQFAAQMAKVGLDQISKNLGPFHRQTLQYQTQWIRFSDVSNKEKEAQLRSTLAKLDAMDVFDARHLEFRINLVAFLFRATTFEDAIEALMVVLDDPMRKAVLDATPDLWFAYHEMAARIRLLQKKLPEAETLYRALLNGALEKYRTTQADEDVMSVMVPLERCLREQGKDEEADKIKDMRQEIVKESLERVGEGEIST